MIGAATIRAVLKGVDGLGIRNGFQDLMQGSVDGVQPLTIEEVSRIHFRGGSVLGTSRANPTTDVPRYTTTLRIDNMVKRTKVERRIAMKTEMLAPMVALTLIVIAIASTAHAQRPTFAPAKGQSAEQQSKDSAECQAVTVKWDFAKNKEGVAPPPSAAGGGRVASPGRGAAAAGAAGAQVKQGVAAPSQADRDKGLARCMQDKGYTVTGQARKRGESPIEYLKRSEPAPRGTK